MKPACVRGRWKGSAASSAAQRHGQREGESQRENMRPQNNSRPTVLALHAPSAAAPHLPPAPGAPILRAALRPPPQLPPLGPAQRQSCPAKRCARPAAASARCAWRREPASAATEGPRAGAQAESRLTRLAAVPALWLSPAWRQGRVLNRPHGCRQPRCRPRPPCSLRERWAAPAPCPERLVPPQPQQPQQPAAGGPGRRLLGAAVGPQRIRAPTCTQRVGAG